MWTAQNAIEDITGREVAVQDGGSRDVIREGAFWASYYPSMQRSLLKEKKPLPIYAEGLAKRDQQAALKPS